MCKINISPLSISKPSSSLNIKSIMNLSGETAENKWQEQLKNHTSYAPNIIFHRHHILVGRITVTRCKLRVKCITVSIILIAHVT